MFRESDQASEGTYAAKCLRASSFDRPTSDFSSDNQDGREAHVSAPHYPPLFFVFPLPERFALSVTGECSDEDLDDEEERNPGEDEERRAQPALSIDLRNQIGRGNVKCNARREWKRVLNQWTE